MHRKLCKARPTSAPTGRPCHGCTSCRAATIARLAGLHAVEHGCWVWVAAAERERHVECDSSQQRVRCALRDPELVRLGHLMMVFPFRSDPLVTVSITILNTVGI